MLLIRSETINKHGDSQKLRRDGMRQTASCKWRDAQRAMRNRQFIGYTLGPLERNVRGRLFDSGGGGCQILIGQIIYFRHGLGREIYFHVAWAREKLFSCKHGKPQSTEAVNNVIESSSIRWNY